MSLTNPLNYATFGIISANNKGAGAQFVPAPGVALSHRRTEMRAKSIPPFTPKQLERFWARVEVPSQPSCCWQWTGARSNGYGSFVVSGFGPFRAHRVAYAILIGDIDGDLVLDHLCRNPLCVNPDHLEPVTSATNTLRGVSICARLSRITHCKRGHTYTEDNIYETPQKPGTRECRICRNVRSRAYKQRQRDRKRLLGGPC